MKDNLVAERQRGATFIILLTLMPLLMTILCGLTAAIIFLITFQKNQFLCRTHLLAAQESMVTSLKSILLLNQQARLIRVNILKAETLAAAAMVSLNIAAIAKTQAELKRWQLQKKLLMLQQQNLINIGQWQAKKVTRKFIASFHKSVSGQKLALQFLLNIFNFYANVSEPKLKVVKADKLLPPVYQVPTNFSQQQEILGRWRMQIRSASEFFNKFLPFNFDFIAKCGTTIMSEGGEWRAVISVVR